jgi:peptidyl-prolyl cis-trans isomerase SurA
VTFRQFLLRTSLALAVSAGALVAQPAHAEVIDRIAAIVNDRVVTLSDVYRLLPVYIQVAGIDPRQLADTTTRQAIANDLLDFLIDTTLMAADADDRDLSITEDEIDQFVDQQRASLGLTSEQFTTELERQGIDIRDFRDIIERNLTRLRMVQLDVLSELRISDDEIDQEISRRYPDGLEEVFISTSHILVPLSAQAPPTAEVEAEQAVREIVTALNSGTPFEALAAQVNPDASRNTGGRLGSFRVDELDADYTRAALALEPGEISDPVRTQFGWHIVRLDNIERRATTDEGLIRDRIYGELHAQYADQRVEVYVDRIRSDAFVERLVENVP